MTPFSDNATATSNDPSDHPEDFLWATYSNGTAEGIYCKAVSALPNGRNSTLEEFAASDPELYQTGAPFGYYLSGRAALDPAPYVWNWLGEFYAVPNQSLRSLETLVSPKRG